MKLSITVIVYMYIFTEIQSNVKLSITVIVYMYIFTEIHENSVLTLGIILVTEMLYIDE